MLVLSTNQNFGTSAFFCEPQTNRHVPAYRIEFALSWHFVVARVSICFQRLRKLQNLLQPLSVEPDDYGITYHDDGKRISPSQTINLAEDFRPFVTSQQIDVNIFKINVVVVKKLLSHAAVHTRAERISLHLHELFFHLAAI